MHVFPFWSISECLNLLKSIKTRIAFMFMQSQGVEHVICALQHPWFIDLSCAVHSEGENYYLFFCNHSFISVVSRPPADDNHLGRSYRWSQAAVSISFRWVHIWNCVYKRMYSWKYTDFTFVFRFIKLYVVPMKSFIYFIPFKFFPLSVFFFLLYFFLDYVLMIKFKF